jgi:DNA-binding NtrC family response regulator
MILFAIIPLPEAPVPNPILLVDADDAFRAELSRALAAAGRTVIEARTTMDALDVLDRHPRVRLAAVTVEMPPRHPPGSALARMLKYRDKTARVVLMSSQEHIVDDAHLTDLGGCLLKAMDAVSMATTITDRLFAATGQAWHDSPPPPSFQNVSDLSDAAVIWA